jgi:hypothetical protein
MLQLLTMHCCCQGSQGCCRERLAYNAAVDTAAAAKLLLAALLQLSLVNPNPSALLMKPCSKSTTDTVAVAA